MLFNDADLNLRAEYTMFDRTNGRPACVGDGERPVGGSPNPVFSHAMPGPDTL